MNEFALGGGVSECGDTPADTGADAGLYPWLGITTPYTGKRRRGAASGQQQDGGGEALPAVVQRCAVPCSNAALQHACLPYGHQRSPGSQDDRLSVACPLLPTAVSMDPFKCTPELHAADPHLPSAAARRRVHGPLQAQARDACLRQQVLQGRHQAPEHGRREVPRGWHVPVEPGQLGRAGGQGWRAGVVGEGMADAGGLQVGGAGW